MSFSRKHQKNVSLGPRNSPLSGTTEFSRSFAAERTRTISEYGSRPITPVVIEPRAVIQKEEWLAAARRSTEHFKKHGSPVPLVWVWCIFSHLKRIFDVDIQVLTEGNEIPDNAVPFGEDRNGCTLYIARALLEGNLRK